MQHEVEVTPEARFDEAYAELKLLGRRTVEQAWRVGEALAAVKADLGHGAWLPWLEGKGMSARTASEYLGLHRLYPEIGGICRFASVEQALLDAKEPLDPATIPKRAKGDGQRARHTRKRRQQEKEELDTAREHADIAAHLLADQEAVAVAAKTRLGEVDMDDALAVWEALHKQDMEVIAKLRDELDRVRKARAEAEQDAAHWKAYAMRFDADLRDESEHPERWAAREH